MEKKQKYLYAYQTLTWSFIKNSVPPKKVKKLQAKMSYSQLFSDTYGFTGFFKVREFYEQVSIKSFVRFFHHVMRIELT